jgi:hypothetical protein
MRCLSICLLLAAFAAHCAPSVEQIFNTGILADCQQVVYCENAALADNALFAPWLKEQFGDPADLDKLPTILKAAYAIIEKMPMRDFSTVKRSQFCADWSLAVTDPKQGWKNIKYLIVYELNVPFSPEEASTLIIEEGKAQNLKFDSTFDSEQEILTITYPNMPACSIAFFHGNKVLMIGESKILQTAAAKARRQIPPYPLNPVLQAARAKIPAGNQFYLLFAPDNNIRAAMQTHAPDSPLAPTLEEIICMTLTMQAGTKITMQVGLEFSSPQSASMGKSMLLDGFFMGMGRMYLTQNAGPELPMLKTMGTTLDGNFAAFSCELTGEDIKMIKPLAQQILKSFAERAAARP